MDKSEAQNPELLGQVAVVTGSSGGIGRAIATQLAVAGANVIVHARENKSGAVQVAEQIQRLGRRVDILLADVSDVDSLPEFVDTCWQRFGGVDIWVNNAGADVLTGTAAQYSFDEKLRRLWQVDVIGTIHLSRLIGEQMRQRGGCILNIGWDRAETGMAGDSGEMFAATKGAVMCFTRSLAKSLAPKVRVNCLAPGWIKTAWGRQASNKWQQRVCRESLVGRWGTPEDVANAARFLASPASSFITGQVISVNGGFKGL